MVPVRGDSAALVTQPMSRSAACSLVVRAALLPELGALSTAPVLIAVATAQVSVLAVRRLVSARQGAPAT